MERWADPLINRKVDSPRPFIALVTVEVVVEGIRGDMMPRKRSNWTREDLHPWMLFFVGTFTLVGQFALFLRHLDVYREYPRESIGILMMLFSLGLVAFIGVAIMLPWTYRTYSRTFGMRYPDAALRIEAILKEAGMPYRMDPYKPARFLFIWRPNTIFVLDHPKLLIQLLGTEHPRRLLGDLTHVYVGKFTRDTKAETKRLLQRLDAIGGA